MERQAILIVDDVELNRAILCELFRGDYEVLEAGDGQEALAVMKTCGERLSAVLLDIIMPVLDGFGVLEAMNQSHIIDLVPVILITAENSENWALRAYELGVSDVINKPFIPSVVRRRVDNLVELYRYRRQVSRDAGQAGDNTPLAPVPLVPVHSAEDTLSGRVLWLLELEREKYRLLSEMSGDIVFNLDLETGRMEFTENFQKIFGGETVYMDFQASLENTEWIPSDDKKILLNYLGDLTPKNPRGHVRIQIRTVAGEYEWFELYVNALWDRDTDRCVGYIGKIININDMKMEMDRWREQAHRDPLTALYNRKAVKEHVEKILESGTTYGALYFIDIDNFKQANDQGGHLYGDEVLRYIGRELRRNFSESGIAGRLGGDEFVVFLWDLENKAQAGEYADFLCGLLRRSPRKDGVGCILSASVGVACFPEHGSAYRELLHKADLALYAAKNRGKNKYAFYEPSLDGVYAIADV